MWQWRHWPDKNSSAWLTISFKASYPRGSAALGQIP